jgi:hypothetical protein
MIGPINVLGTTPGKSRWSYCMEMKQKENTMKSSFSGSSFHSWPYEERV